MIRYLTILLATILVASGQASAQQKPSGRRGGFVVLDDSAYKKSLDSLYAKGMPLLPSSSSDTQIALDVVAADLNRRLVMSPTVRMQGRHCGRADAHYDPLSKTIVVCHELIESIQRTLSSTGQPSDSVGVKSLAALFVATAHEVGHALIDVLDLPVLGREEDAADQYAIWHTLEVMDIEDDDVRIQSIAALSFSLLTWGKVEANTSEAMTGQHPLALQRVVNYLCWMSGAGRLVGFSLPEVEALVPQKRLLTCADEYSQLRSGWQRLLAPYSKK